MKTHKSEIISSGLFALSSILLTISMPPFLNIPFLGFAALVPAISALRMYRSRKNFLLILLFFGLIYTSVSYSWYTDIFSSIWGYVLIAAVALWHSSLIRNGVKFEAVLPEKFQVFALPLIYSLLEFAQRSIPFIKEWWFIPYPKSQWGFPESLQLLSITGITGLTFIMILSNSTIAKIIQNIIEKKKNSKLLFVNLLIVAGVLSSGYYTVNKQNDTAASRTFRIGLVSDMANSITEESREGYYIQDKKLSQRILKENLLLSKDILPSTDFIVWPENEFLDFNDNDMLEELKTTAHQSSTYMVVDSYKQDKEKLYDTAVLIAPDKTIAGFAEKTHLFSSEISAGFFPSPKQPRAIQTEKVKAGLGVCYDFHFTDVVRYLAKDGAELILMPADDDMNQNRFFPYYHATDAVFRAVENKVAVGSANTNGASILVNPAGKIISLSPVNEASSVTGAVNINTNKTIYTKWGDWFAYLLLIIVILASAVKIYKRRVLS